MHLWSGKIRWERERKLSGSLVYTTKSGIVITFTIKASTFDYEIASATDAKGTAITVTKN